MLAFMEYLTDNIKCKIRIEMQIVILVYMMKNISNFYVPEKANIKKPNVFIVKCNLKICSTILECKQFKF